MKPILRSEWIKYYKSQVGPLIAHDKQQTFEVCILQQMSDQVTQCVRRMNEKYFPNFASSHRLRETEGSCRGLTSFSFGVGIVQSSVRILEEISTSCIRVEEDEAWRFLKIIRRKSHPLAHGAREVRGYSSRHFCQRSNIWKKTKPGVS